MIILLKPKLIIYAYGASPTDVIGRSQQVATRLAKKAKVLYIVMNTVRTKHNKNDVKTYWEPMRDNKNLFVLPTPLFVPFSMKLNFLNYLNGYRVARMIENFLKEMDIKKEEVLFLGYTPLSAILLKFFPQFKVHYDCADDFTNWHGVSEKQAIIYKNLEGILIQRALTVSTASKHMYDKLSRYHNKVMKIPNGVEVQKFNIRSQAEPFISSEKPIVGFVGATAGFLDIDLIKGLIENCPQYKFVFVGPLESLQKSLPHTDNIEFTGRVDYEEIPYYMNSFDICMIPANKKPASLAADAAKLYQYLSTGKPIVTTDLPELTEHKDYIYISSNKKEFLDNINKSLEEDEKNIIKRKKYSENFDWDITTEKMFNLFVEDQISDDN